MNSIIGNICKGVSSQFKYLSIIPNFYSSISSLPERTVKSTESLPAATDVEPDKLFSTVEIEMRGHDPAVLKSYAWFSSFTANQLNITVGKNYAMRKSEKERYTLLKSVHIYKKHRVQYEIRTYFRFLHLHRLTGSTADTYLEYIQRNLPEGVALKISKVELQPMPEHIKTPK